MFFFSINTKTSNLIILVFIMLLKMFKNLKRVWHDTKYIIHWSLDKIAQKRHEITNLVIWNWEFDEIISYQIQKILVEDHEIVVKLFFCLIIIDDTQKFLLTTNLNKLMFSNIFVNRRTFCFFRCFNRTCQMFNVVLLTKNRWSTNSRITSSKTMTKICSTKLSTINVMTKL